jgi:hypothetical protein
MSVRDDETASNWTAFTPAETATIRMEDNEDMDLLKDDPLTISSSVPWPGSTFIISHAATSAVITLSSGRVTLSPPGGPPSLSGSIHWDCVDINGWVGFRNRVSGTWLGYDKGGTLICGAGRPQEWEQFCVRAVPDGGFILLMTHWHALKPVGVSGKLGDEKLVKLGNGKTLDGTVWKFVKV